MSVAGVFPVQSSGGEEEVELELRVGGQVQTVGNGEVLEGLGTLGSAAVLVTDMQWLPCARQIGEGSGCFHSSNITYARAGHPSPY